MTGTTYSSCAGFKWFLLIGLNMSVGRFRNPPLRPRAGLGTTYGSTLGGASVTGMPTLWGTPLSLMSRVFRPQRKLKSLILILVFPESSFLCALWACPDSALPPPPPPGGGGARGRLPAVVRGGRGGTFPSCPGAPGGWQQQTRGLGPGRSDTLVGVSSTLRGAGDHPRGVAPPWRCW